MIAILADHKEQLGITEDLGNADDAMLYRKLEAAERHVERMLGFTFDAAEAEPREGFEDGTPAPLVEAVLQLAAHWYEAREAATEANLREIPFGVTEIVSGYRDWTF